MRFSTQYDVVGKFWTARSNEQRGFMSYNDVCPIGIRIEGNILFSFRSGSVFMIRSVT